MQDPNAPKGPRNGFILWLAENRKNIHKPGMGIRDDMKAASRTWGALSEKKKAIWYERASQDKLRYEREMAAYNTAPRLTPMPSTSSR